MKSVAGNLIAIALFIAVVVGEVMCFTKCIFSDWKAPYKHEIIYGLSALTGFGAIVGYFNIPDGEGK